MTINQDFLDEFDKFLPKINKAEEEHESIVTAMITNVPDYSLDAAIELLNKPVNLGARSMSYDYQVSMEDIIVDKMKTEIDKQIMDSILATSQQPITVPYSSPYGMVDHGHNYSVDGLAVASPAMGDVYLTAANPVSHNTIQITGDDGSSVEIKTDGTVTVSGDIEMDEIASKFWDAISQYAPENPESVNYLKEEVRELTAVNTFLESVAGDQEDVIADLKARLQSYETDKIDESENQLSFDLEAVPSEPESGYFDAPYIPITKTNDFNPYSYNPYSKQEDFIFPNYGYGRGSKVETLPDGQGLGALDDLEYFQRKVAKSMTIPSDMMKAMHQAELLKAQVAIKPSLTLTKEEAKQFGIRFEEDDQGKAFDDAMELVK